MMRALSEVRNGFIGSSLLIGALVLQGPYLRARRSGRDKVREFFAGMSLAPFPGMTVLWLFAVEAAVLLSAWLRARRGDFHVRRRKIACPLGGEPTILDVAEEGPRREILRCALLERDVHRRCDRSCVAALSSGASAAPPPPARARIARIPATATSV
jgi:hypothetical protein